MTFLRTRTSQSGGSSSVVGICSNMCIQLATRSIKCGTQRSVSIGARLLSLLESILKILQLHSMNFKFAHFFVMLQRQIPRKHELVSDVSNFTAKRYDAASASSCVRSVNLEDSILSSTQANCCQNVTSGNQRTEGRIDLRILEIGSGKAK
jgi:hypothetical protein